MSRLELTGVSDGALRLASGSFEPACTVVTGDDASALARFAAVASGVAPARGVVLLDAEPLAAWPPARRRLAAALAEEALPSAPDVAAAVGNVLAARGEHGAARALLERFGLGVLGGARPAALDRDELRSVALALALAHATADVLVLYEPLSTGMLEPALVREGVAAAVARHAIVLIVTASLEAAQSFGGPHATVAGGVLTPAAGAA